MKKEVERTLSRLREMGMNFTLDGPFVADFIENLDKVVEIDRAKLDGSKLELLVGDLKKCSPQDVLEVVTMATLLNVTASGMEKGSQGKHIWFEWYIHAQQY